VIGPLLLGSAAIAEPTTVGEWDDTIAGTSWKHRIKIQEKGSGYVRINDFGGGQIDRGELVEVEPKAGQQRAFRDPNSAFGEFYAINTKGDLDLYDRTGFIRTARRISKMNARPSSSDESEKKKGFRDLVFGTAISSVPGMKCERFVFFGPPSLRKDLADCERASDRLVIGDVKLSEIAYLVYKDRLYRVYIRPLSSDGDDDLRMALTKAFGTPKIDGKDIKWDGRSPATKNLHPDVFVDFTPRGRILTKSRALISYRPILEQMKRDEKEQQKRDEEALRNRPVKDPLHDL
jgi:hypothetical protein